MRRKKIVENEMIQMLKKEMTDAINMLLIYS